MRTSWLLLSCALVACGGRIDDSGEAPVAAPASNAPASTTSGDGCTRACDRMTSTCSAIADDGECLRACRSGLGDDPDAARRYAACLEELSCADIQRGVTMDYGPIGQCFTRARRGP
jgi:hypothetical protein